MDDIVKFFVVLGSGVNSLFVLMFGCLVGVIVGKYFQKQWSPEYDVLAEAVDSVSRELDKTDETLSLLWQRARLRSDQRTAVRRPRATPNPNASRIDPLTWKLISLKSKAKRVSADIEFVSPWLSASQTRQGQTPRNSQIERLRSQIPIVRRHPDDRDLVSHGDVSLIDAEFDELDEWHRRGIRQAEKRSSGASVSPREPGEAETIIAELVDLYNLAVTDQLCREKFRERFKPLRIGTANAVERSQNPTLPAEIRETTDGNLFASVVSKDNLYVVVPRLGLTIEAVSYGAGALSEVFSETSDHDPKLYYSRYRVLKPALFLKHSDDNWELRSPGKLDLGPGE